MKNNKSNSWAKAIYLLAILVAAICVYAFPRPKTELAGKDISAVDSLSVSNNDEVCLNIEDGLSLREGSEVSNPANEEELDSENDGCPEEDDVLEGYPDEDDVIDDYPTEDFTFDNYYTQPEFPGGETALFEFLKTNLQYPDECVEDSIGGRVTLSFIVTKEGNVTDIEIMRSPDERLSAEAIRVVKMMPKWTPGKDNSNGEIVDLRLVLPVTFRLK